MQPERRHWQGRIVGVVGGTGFLGLHLVRQLHGLGARLRIVGLPPRNGAPAAVPTEAEIFLGDVRDRALLDGALADCSVVFNVAGPVAVSGASLEEVHDSAIRNVLATTGSATQVVHTSSIAAVNMATAARIYDEDSPFDPWQLRIDYVRAKRKSEATALCAARTRNVVVVNPAFLVGPEDHDRSFMGKLCMRFWHGRMPVAPPGGLNLVDVRDVALGHLLAAERGQSGRRYILGGANVLFREFLLRLAAASEYRPRWLPALPGPMLSLVAAFAEARAWLRGKEPFPSLAETQITKRFGYVSSHRASAELGYRCRPLDESLRDTFAWHLRAGKIRPRGLSAWWVRANTGANAA